MAILPIVRRFYEWQVSCSPTFQSFFSCSLRVFMMCLSGSHKLLPFLWLGVVLRFVRNYFLEAPDLCRARSRLELLLPAVLSSVGVGPFWRVGRVGEESPWILGRTGMVASFGVMGLIVSPFLESQAWWRLVDLNHCGGTFFIPFIHDG